MFILLTILIVFAAILMVLLVLVQNSKGGGLASGFAGGNQVMGAPKTADFLEKATWTLFAIIVLLSVFAVGVRKSQQNVVSSDDSGIATAAEQVMDTPAPAAAPAAEAPAAPAEAPAQPE